MSNTFDIAEFQQRPGTYLGENRAAADKDVFKFLKRTLEGHGVTAPTSILDIGCATGDLLAFLGRKYPSAALTGLDIDATLIETAAAREELTDATLIVGDGRSADIGQFSLTTCFGMLGIFDDCEPVLDQLLMNTARGGRVAVQALLNPDDIDVRIAYKDHLNGLDWMRGFNIFSRQRVERWAASKPLKVEFHDFHMTSELPKRPNLPHRAHTLDTADGRRRSINGLCLLLPETLLVIHVDG